MQVFDVLTNITQGVILHSKAVRVMRRSRDRRFCNSRSIDQQEDYNESQDEDQGRRWPAQQRGTILAVRHATRPDP